MIPNQFVRLVRPTPHFQFVCLVAFQSRQSDENPLEAIDIGETIIALMEEAGFNSSVLWPGYFNCFELYLLAGDGGKARYYADR